MSISVFKGSDINEPLLNSPSSFPNTNMNGCASVDLHSLLEHKFINDLQWVKNNVFKPCRHMPDLCNSQSIQLP